MMLEGCGGPMLVDSHAHLDDKKFEGELEAVLERARQAGVGRIVTVGSGIASSEACVRLASEYRGFLYAAVGVHPHEARLFDESAGARLRELAGADGVVAVGETGLDYHYDNSPRETQRRVFACHIELALETGLPLVVHCREAFAECLEIVRGYEAEGLRGVAHCFSGSAEDARAFLEMGFLISFGGVVTYRNAERVRRVAAGVPLDRTLVETDSPYLAPQGKRGQRNEPAFVTEVAAMLAVLHGVSAQAVASTTTRNAQRLYGIPVGAR